MTQPAMRSDARANRVRLLEAATAVFAERGTEADVKEVAERAELAVGTIYRHFPGKDELIAAVMDQAMDEFTQAVDDGLAQADPLAGLELFVRGGVAVIGRYGELMTALFEGRVPDLRPPDLRAARRAQNAERIATLVRKAVQADVLRADLNVDVAAAALRAAFVPWLLVELRRSYEPDRIATEFLDLFLHGARRR
ncbi:MAG: TetR/AcrR family transcriptional regulator [Dehalococcoidia bacterium]